MTGLPPVDRRTAIGVFLAWFAAACTTAEETATSTSGPSPSATTTPAPTTAEPALVPTVTTTQTLDPLTPPPVELPPDVFGLGIASGEPDDESVVLWTRLVGALPESFEIVWEIADTAEFTALAATSMAVVTSEAGHSVRAVASGLAADREYWFRFRAGDQISAIGRTQTMPKTADLRPITLGVSSCQAREGGAWAAHGDLAVADVDVVIWLGDYIYGEHRTLDEYRAAYAAYRSDPLLQASHAAHPWIVFADDHEVANDYDVSVDPARRAAAYRAWWENQPTRLPPPDDEGHLGFQRSFTLGGSVHLVGLDVRQFAGGSAFLGDDQWRDLESGSGVEAGNTVVASPVLMSGIRDLDGEPLLRYTIDSRPNERARLAAWLSTMPSPIIVSGDLHTSLVADFSADPLDPTSAAVATEIMAPAISSAFPERFAPLAPFLPLINPQLRQVEVANGWLELTLSAEQEPTATFHFVDDITDPESSITLRPIPL